MQTQDGQIKNDSELKVGDRVIVGGQLFKIDRIEEHPRNIILSEDKLDDET